MHVTPNYYSRSTSTVCCQQEKKEKRYNPIHNGKQQQNKKREKNVQETEYKNQKLINKKRREKKQQQTTNGDKRINEWILLWKEEQPNDHFKSFDHRSLFNLSLFAVFMATKKIIHTFRAVASKEKQKLRKNSVCIWKNAANCFD